MKRLLAAGATFAAAASLFAGVAFAHGGPASNNPVDPDDPSCMGQLASMHAKDDGGQKNSVENRSHSGFGGPFDTVQEQMKAFKAYCDQQTPEPPGSGF